MIPFISSRILTCSDELLFSLASLIFLFKFKNIIYVFSSRVLLSPSNLFSNSKRLYAKFCSFTSGSACWSFKDSSIAFSISSSDISLPNRVNERAKRYRYIIFFIFISVNNYLFFTLIIFIIANLF